MAREDKPSRVYRGGRATAKVPTARSARIRPAKSGGGGRSYRGPATGTRGPVRRARPVALAIEEFTGLDVNHVIVVNFGDFKDLIDALGGVDVNVPKPIRSNRFDCPYPTQARCQKWQGWRFPKGMQHMGGERALIYSRIRE